MASRLASLIETAKTPGIQYVAVNADGIMFAHAGGWADLRDRVSLDAETTLMAYSMSKTITAVATLQLVEAGRVRLDEPVERYVGALPYGPLVTVRPLIAHTSGSESDSPTRGCIQRRVMMHSTKMRRPRRS